jgi:predicted kinase
MDRMSQVVLIIGLPGSGKTHLAQTAYVSAGYVLIDDPTDLGAVLDTIYSNPKVVVTDPHLTRRDVRDNALDILRQMGCDVDIVYFENDPKAAKANLQRRGGERASTNVDMFSRMYDIPEGATTVPVYKPS